MPAFNEEKRIGKVLQNLFKILSSNNSLKYNVIVVDDGSYDATSFVAKKTKAIVLTHPINRGVGAATLTGIEMAKKIGSDFVITIDSDNQHETKEIFSVLKPALKGQADVVVGSRFLGDTKEMPLFKKIGNGLLNLMVLTLYGVKCTDTQSGFRAFNKKAINSIKLTIDRYGFISELFPEVKLNKLQLKEVPIKTIYVDKQGTTFIDGLKIALDLLTRVG